MMPKRPAAKQLQRALKALHPAKKLDGGEWTLKTFQVESRVLERFLEVTRNRRLLLKASISEAILLWLIENDPHVDQKLDEFSGKRRAP